MNYRESRGLFATRLRQLRRAKKLTQEGLAEKVNKTVEHVSFLERGERSPSFETLIDLANVFEISLANLLTFQDIHDKHSQSYLSEQLELFESKSEVTPTNTLNTLSSAVSVEDIIATPIQPEAVETTSIQEAVASKSERKTDLQRLQSAFEGIRQMQALANEYGISDILQDNGGKVLQVLILLGLKISPGREGNDAIDEDGNEYELKTINHALRKNAGITTHHHLNVDILNKYRQVKAWYIAIYEGIELKKIYKVVPSILETLFAQWEEKIKSNGPMNNPKIPIRYVIQGELVYQSS